MHDEAGNLSLDFLVGFTIFLLAFIWVATMVSGIMVNLQSSHIDYDAVAYRTGVILVEDPGWPASPAWELYGDNQKFSISRFGLAVSKESPGILSQDKINRFFCTSFIYPDDYQSRVIFGKYPYRFNISVTDLTTLRNQSVGDVLPDEYGYIRRLAKIKTDSNATIGPSYYIAHNYNNTGTPSDFNVTQHQFSILINGTRLLGDQRNPAYQIDPNTEPIMINLTNLNSTLWVKRPPVNPATKISLTGINVYVQHGNTLSLANTWKIPYIDGKSVSQVPPWPVIDNISLMIDPYNFSIMSAGYSNVYFNLTFNLMNNAGTSANGSFLNNTFSGPFDYNYNGANVTQPQLDDAVVEVAAW